MNRLQARVEDPETRGSSKGGGAGAVFTFPGAPIADVPACPARPGHSDVIRGPRGASMTSLGAGRRLFAVFGVSADYAIRRTRARTGDRLYAWIGHRAWIPERREEKKNKVKLQVVSVIHWNCCKNEDIRKIKGNNPL